MPQVPILMPQLGESIAEATVINLLVQVGDPVETDQDVLEVETNKATMNVSSRRGTGLPRRPERPGRPRTGPTSRCRVAKSSRRFAVCPCPRSVQGRPTCRHG